MQRTFPMILLVFTAYQSQSRFSDPFFINYSHKKKNGHLFLSIFKFLPDFISLFLRKIIKYLL